MPSTLMTTLANTIVIARDREDGQTLVEYALIIMLIALALVIALGALAGELDNFYTTVSGVF